MDREQRIREIAYRLWVAEGYPRDQNERHRRMAVQMLTKEECERRTPSAKLGSGNSPDVRVKRVESTIPDKSAIGDDPKSRQSER